MELKKETFATDRLVTQFNRPGNMSLRPWRKTLKDFFNNQVIVFKRLLLKT